MRQKAIDELLANRAEIDLQLALRDFQESENGARRKGARHSITPGGRHSESCGVGAAPRINSPSSRGRLINAPCSSCSDGTGSFADFTLSRCTMRQGEFKNKWAIKWF
jgi:ribosomal protein S14